MDENDGLEDNKYILYSQKDTEDIFKGMKEFFETPNADNKRVLDPFNIRQFHSQFFRCDSLITSKKEFLNNITKTDLIDNMKLEDIHPYKIKQFDLLDKEHSPISHAADYQDTPVEIRPLVNKDDTINTSEINKLISLFHDKTGQVFHL